MPGSVCRTQAASVVKSYTYDDGCESCGTDTFNREPFVVMFSSKLSGTLSRRVLFSCSQSQLQLGQCFRESVTFLGLG